MVAQAAIYAVPKFPVNKTVFIAKTFVLALLSLLLYFVDIYNVMLYSRLPRVQILGDACKWPTAGCLLPVGVFNPVILYSNYLFLSICVECL